MQCNTVKDYSNVEILINAKKYDLLKCRTLVHFSILFAPRGTAMLYLLYELVLFSMPLNLQSVKNTHQLGLNLSG